MAKLLWGKVYYQDVFAGYLRQETGERYTFTYAESYLESTNPAIAMTLPRREDPFISEGYLPGFFDNMVAEGWLQGMQMRLLGKRHCSRLELLLAFGLDCAGAVSVVDPEQEPLHLSTQDQKNPQNLAVFHSRASLSGIQPKLTLVKEGNTFRPAQQGEVSTYIAKLPSETVADIVHNEWLTLIACQALLPEDSFVEMQLAPLDKICDEALVVKRFDRDKDGKRIHFEEFNQLLNHASIRKYEGAYKDMADFMYTEKKCIPTDVYRLYKRIIVGLIMGNTDMHFKNFACIYHGNQLTLSPSYDQVAAAIYQPYQYVALELNNISYKVIGDLKAKHIISLGHDFRLSDSAIHMAVEEIGRHIPGAIEKVHSADRELPQLKGKIIQQLEKRWRGTFSLIGQLLSKKR